MLLGTAGSVGGNVGGRVGGRAVSAMLWVDTSPCAAQVMAG